MNVLLFSNTLSVTDKRLQAVIEAQIPFDNFHVCRQLETLKNRLSAPGSDLLVVILMAHERRTLEAMAPACEECHNLPVILVLPDKEQKTLYLGRKFSPCFISYTDSDFSDVALVLAKMMMRDAQAKVLKSEAESLQQSRILKFS